MSPKRKNARHMAFRRNLRPVNENTFLNILSNIFVKMIEQTTVKVKTSYLDREIQELGSDRVMNVNLDLWER